MREGRLAAVVWAAAGLARLGLAEVDAVALDPDELLPAVGQGALALEYREADGSMRARLDAMADADATVAVAAERGFLDGIGGDCDTPLAAHARVRADVVELHALVTDRAGTRRLDAHGDASRAAAAELGQVLAARLLARGARELLGR
jgi:porphobilinogen deaminase